MSEAWDLLSRKVQRGEKRLERVEAAAPMAGVWYAALSAVHQEASKTLYAASRGRMARVQYELSASSAVSVTVTLNGETLSFSHAAGNPCMTVLLPLNQGNNNLCVRVAAGAAGVSRGGVCAEQVDVQT